MKSAASQTRQFLSDSYLHYILMVQSVKYKTRMTRRTYRGSAQNGKEPLPAKTRSLDG
jgi:hypothetical protein